MCGGLIEMQSRRAPRLHEDMKQYMPHAAADQQGPIGCCSPRRSYQPAAPAGLAIVAALEAELVQSEGTKSRTKPPESTTSSLPIPISASSSSSSDISKDAYCISIDHFAVKNHTRGAPKSIFSTSLSPPCDTYNYIMSSNFYTELYDDFLGSCFYCKRPLAPGKDIYMYRGDRAFCSIECRYKHIVVDESLPCTIPTNQQCVQASSPTKPTNLAPPVAIAILV